MFVKIVAIDSKSLKTLIKQGFFLIARIFKKTPNQLARLGKQTPLNSSILYKKHKYLCNENINH